jgi:hypothetical protein
MEFCLQRNLIISTEIETEQKEQIKIRLYGIDCPEKGQLLVMQLKSI